MDIVAGVASTMDKSQAEDTESARIAAAAVRTWDEVFVRLAPLIGEQGVGLLYRRSLHLNAAKFPFLAPSPVDLQKTPSGSPFSGLKLGLERQTPAKAEEASRALFSTFTGLLGTLIGKTLTTRLLTPVPPDSDPEDSPQEIAQ